MSQPEVMQEIEGGCFDNKILGCFCSTYDINEGKCHGTWLKEYLERHNEGKQNDSEIEITLPKKKLRSK